MIVEKNLVIFVLVLHFRCAFCNDNVSTSQKTTVVMATKVDYNSGSTASPRSGISYDRKFMEIFTSSDPVSTENIMSVVKHNNAESMKNITNFMTYDSESTKNLNSLMNYETAIMNPYELIVENELLTAGIQSEADMKWTSSPVTDNSTDTTWSKSIPDIVTTNTISTSSSDDITDTWEVMDLKINDVNTEWITLSWESPYMNATNISVIYSVERCDSENNCNKTDEYDTWHNATDLDACTQYTFIVKVITEVWESAGIKLSATTADNISEIDDVLYLNVRDIDVNSVRLIWQEPLKHARCISNYLIIQCDVISKLCNETVVLTANHSAINLEPCTKYYFTVKTITSVVQSPGVNVTTHTASPKLSKPQSVKITPGNFSLTVKWHPPEFGSVCLKYYRITIDSIKYSFNTTKTNVIISDLHACTSYSVNVNAVNKDNDDGAAVSKTSTTCRTRTNPPVLHKNALVTVNSISIIWSIEKEKNPCTLTSIITTCNYTASNGTGYEFVNGVSVTEIEPEIAAAPVVVMNTTVTKLSPFTSYTCWAYTVNIGGFSELSNGVNAKTMEDAPSPPTFHVVNITDSQFSLTWDLPEYLAGNLEDFEIALVWESLLPIPEWCPREAPNNDNITKLNGSTLHYDYLKAKAYTNYTVMMRAKTGAGWGAYSTSQTFQSNRRVPEAASKFVVTIKENSNNTNILDTILTWGLPCSLNGELETFNISVYGTRDGYIPHFFSIMNECTDYIYNDYMCSINLKELKGEYNYTFAISTKVKHVDNFGPTASQDGILYPAGIPSQPDEEYMNLITIDPYKMIRSTTKVTILLPLFPDTNGDIKYYAIMVSEIGYNKPSTRRFDVKSKIWPNTSSWEEAMISDFSITYQATRPKWDPYPNYIADYGHMKAVKYTIGEDTTCKEISSNTNKRLYCNGPLKPNTWYHVRMRAFTYGGYTDSEIFVIRTNAELNVAIVIGIVFGILFLGLLTTMMLLVRKCSPYVLLRRFLHSDMPGSPVPAPFTRKKFIAHCQQLIDNPGKLSNEFRLLQTLSVDLQMPTNAACLQANRRKNRYSDILPYDFSRVKLDVIDNDPNTDYINASFIRGYTGEDEYIACQGPKEETTYDFWRMVDQCNINIIIMLTELIEKGKEKCHQYYPTIRETFRYENMTIRCTSELDFRTHTQRTLVLQKENRKRNITHLHFKDWPDYDVPEDFDAMINFCQIMRRNINANKGFVVVHCSAGIGRTGTLIAIDTILQHLRDNRKIDVFGTVYRLRHHRINMVQRDTQYAYIYNCIKQVLKNPYFLKTYKPPPVDPVYENISKNAKDPRTSNTNLVNNLRSQMSLQLYPRCDVPETNI